MSKVYRIYRVFCGQRYYRQDSIRWSEWAHDAELFSYSAATEIAERESAKVECLGESDKGDSQ